MYIRPSPTCWRGTHYRPTLSLINQFSFPSFACVRVLAFPSRRPSVGTAVHTILADILSFFYLSDLSLGRPFTLAAPSLDTAHRPTLLNVESLLLFDVTSIPSVSRALTASTAVSLSLTLPFLPLQHGVSSCASSLYILPGILVVRSPPRNSSGPCSPLSVRMHPLTLGAL